MSGVSKKQISLGVGGGEEQYFLLKRGIAACGRIFCVIINILRKICI
jgi:hypothetical protein